jgi:hypothetical protein
MTPNAGMGGNMAIEDAASLTNALRAALYGVQDAPLPKSSLQAVFRRYHDRRIQRVKKTVLDGGGWTRFQAYETWSYYLIFRCITPKLVGLRAIAAGVARKALGAPKLDFVEYQGRCGSIPWLETYSQEVQAGPSKSTARRRYLGKFRGVLWLLPVVLGLLWLLLGMRPMDLVTSCLVVVGVLEKTEGIR